MAEKVNIVLVIVSAILAVIALVLAFQPAQVIEKEVPVIVEKQVVVYVPVNDTVQDAAANKFLEDDQWESDAIVLANDKLDNEDLASWLIAQNISIKDEDDFVYVKVDDTDVYSADADDKDAKVVLSLIVKYEKTDGQTGKSYVDVTFNVRDNRIRDSGVSYAFA